MIFLSNLPGNRAKRTEMGVRCDPVGLQSVTLHPHTVSISQPAEAPSACVVCLRICSSISILNDCLTAPPLLAASSTTSALCPHYHADLYFQKYNSLIIPAVIVFVRGAKLGRALSEKAFMCSAASVHLFSTSSEKERRRSTAVYSSSLRGRRRVRHGFGFWQDSKGNHFDF